MITKKITALETWESHIQLENVNFSFVVNLLNALDTNEMLFDNSLHTHIYYELFVCGKDSITLQTENGYLHLYAGDAALVPIGIRHVLMNNPQPDDYEVISFICFPTGGHLQSALYRALYPLLNAPDILVLRHHPTLFSQIQEITHDRDRKNKPAFYPALHMSAILLDIALMQPEQKKSTVNIAPADSLISKDIQLINILEQLINMNDMQPIRIVGFAEQLHISPRQLERIVEKHYGKCLRRVIIEERLRNAEKFLLCSDMTVEKIALAVGFNSKTRFYREFYSKHQMTPTKYRKTVSADS